MRVCAFQKWLFGFQHLDDAWSVSFVLAQLFQKVLRDRPGPWLRRIELFGNVSRCVVTLGVDEVLL